MFFVRSKNNFVYKKTNIFKDTKGHYFEFFTDINYTYDRKFEGNILIVGQTGCGKQPLFKTLQNIIYLVN